MEPKEPEEPEDFYDDENQVVDYCVNCGESYDDADFDFMICSHCGYDANEKKIKPHCIDPNHEPF